MRTLSLTTSTLCFLMFAVSMVNAAEQKSCVDQLQARTNDLKGAKSELSAELQKLSAYKSCALDFDIRVAAENEIVTVKTELETLVGKISALKEDVTAVVKQIQESSKLPENAAVETDFNQLLAERLAYRSRVKTWQLRDSVEVTDLEAELAKIVGDIAALQKRIDGVSDWQDRSALNNLAASENKLTQALADVQRKLTGLDQKRADPKYTAAQEFEAEGPGRTSALGEAVEGLARQIEQLERDITSEQTSIETATAQIQILDVEVASLTSQLDNMKSSQSNSTEGLASAQIEKTRLSPILQDLRLQETLLASELQRILPQAEATESIVNQLAGNVAEKTDQIASLDSQIAVDTESAAVLQKRVDYANQDITAIRSQMSSEFKPLLEFQNVSNQVFALELTIDGLDKEIDNLDMRAAGAEGKLNRFIRACKRKPACKSALNL
jgi:chromosome segregation ATPase